MQSSGKDSFCGKKLTRALFTKYDLFFHIFIAEYITRAGFIAMDFHIFTTFQDGRIGWSRISPAASLHGVPPLEIFEAVEHPLEPVDVDQPARCPAPERSIVRDGLIWREMLAGTLRHQSEKGPQIWQEGDVVGFTGTAPRRRTQRSPRENCSSADFRYCVKPGGPRPLYIVLVRDVAYTRRRCGPASQARHSSQVDWQKACGSL